MLAKAALLAYQPTIKHGGSCALPGAEMWICSLHKQPKGRAGMVSGAYLCGCAIKKEKPGEDGLMADSCAIYFCFTFDVLVRNS
jgi:hypothetical protein